MARKYYSYSPEYARGYESDEEEIKNEVKDVFEKGRTHDRRYAKDSHARYSRSNLKYLKFKVVFIIF